MQCQHPNSALVETLRRQIARLEGNRRWDRAAAVPSGCEPLDNILPGMGFHRGTLVEWLAGGAGSGAEILALMAARAACREGGAVVVLDPRREFYPPAAARLGIPLEDLILVYAATAADNLWALDQALRSPAVAAAVAWPERLDGRNFRRLQLAAEGGGGLGLLIRPLAARQEPTWADVRLLVEPLPSEVARSLCDRTGATGCLSASAAKVPRPLDTRHGAPRLLSGSFAESHRRRLKIELLHCRGATSTHSIEVEIDDETRTVHLAPRVAETTARYRVRA